MGLGVYVKWSAVVESVGLWEIPVGAPRLVVLSAFRGRRRVEGLFLSISLLSLLRTGDDMGHPGTHLLVPLRGPSSSQAQGACSLPHSSEL